MTVIDDLCEALAGIPPLRGSRCKGRWDIWDEHEDPEVVEYAIAMCGGCKALQECREWVDSLRSRDRPTGTTAGVCRRPRKPRKKAA